MDWTAQSIYFQIVRFYGSKIVTFLRFEFMFFGSLATKDWLSLHIKIKINSLGSFALIIISIFIMGTSKDKLLLDLETFKENAGSS